MVSPGQMANRRLLVYLLAAAGIVTFLWTTLSTRPYVPTSHTPVSYSKVPIHQVNVDVETLQGKVIMPKLGNETAKAELGRAAWKLLHTTMSRFPDKPTHDEQIALTSYIHLFARLYPCGECAGHFREILNKFPPQVRTRSRAAAWACNVHNEVNKSLNKAIFDCAKIGDFYDCGCEEGPKKGKDGDKKEETKTTETADSKEKKDSDDGKLVLEKEPRMRGG